MSNTGRGSGSVRSQNGEINVDVGLQWVRSLKIYLLNFDDCYMSFRNLSISILYICRYTYSIINI